MTHAAKPSRSRRWLRRLSLALLVLFIAGLLFYNLFVPTIARNVAAGILEDMGFTDVELDVHAVSTTGLYASNLREGSQQFRVGAIGVNYQLGDLLGGQVETITLIGVEWEMQVRDGQITIAPFDALPQSESDEPADELPFRTIRLKSSIVGIDWDGYKLRAPVDATITSEGMNHFSVDMTVDVMGTPLHVAGLLKPYTDDKGVEHLHLEADIDFLKRPMRALGRISPADEKVDLVVQDAEQLPDAMYDQMVKRRFIDGHKLIVPVDHVRVGLTFHHTPKGRTVGVAASFQQTDAAWPWPVGGERLSAGKVSGAVHATVDQNMTITQMGLNAGAHHAKWKDLHLKNGRVGFSHTERGTMASCDVFGEDWDSRLNLTSKAPLQQLLADDEKLTVQADWKMSGRLPAWITQQAAALGLTIDQHEDASFAALVNAQRPAHEPDDAGKAKWRIWTDEVVLKLQNTDLRASDASWAMQGVQGTLWAVAEWTPDKLAVRLHPDSHLGFTGADIGKDQAVRIKGNELAPRRLTWGPPRRGFRPGVRPGVRPVVRPDPQPDPVHPAIVPLGQPGNVHGAGAQPRQFAFPLRDHEVTGEWTVDLTDGRSRARFLIAMQQPLHVQSDDLAATLNDLRVTGTFNTVTADADNPDKDGHADNPNNADNASNKGLQLNLAFEQSNIKLEEHALTLGNVSASLPFALHGPNNADPAAQLDGKAKAEAKADTSPPGKFTIDGITFRDQSLPAITGHAHYTAGHLRAAAQWRPLTHAQRQVDAHIDLTGRDPVGVVHLKAPTFAWADDDRALARALLPHASDLKLNGSFAIDGRIDYARGEVQPDIRLTASDVSVESRTFDLAARGVSGSVTVNGFAPLSTPGRQTLTVGQLSIGKLDLNDGTTAFRIENPDSIFIERAKLSWGEKGTFYVHAFRLQPSLPEYDVEVFVENLELDDWIELLSVKRVTGSGRLYGRVPIAIKPKAANKVAVGRGILYVIPEPGKPDNGTGPSRANVLQFHDSDLLRQMLIASEPRFGTDPKFKEALENIVQALQDFKYDRLTFDFIPRPEHDDLQLRIITNGRGFDRPGIKGIPIGNLTVNLNIGNEVIKRALILQRGSEDAIDDNLSDFFKP